MIPDLLYARGLVTAQLKRLAEHERDMRRLIELQPDNAHAYNALGYTLADQSIRLDEALALINKAIELQPGDPFILDSLGWVQYRLRNYGAGSWQLKEGVRVTFGSRNCRASRRGIMGAGPLRGSPRRMGSWTRTRGWRKEPGLAGDHS